MQPFDPAKATSDTVPCPSDVVEVVTEILKHGILSARASSHDARRVVQQLDHVHNLPALLHDYRPELLAFYWNTERAILLKQLSNEECRGFQSAWEKLRPLVERECGPFAGATTATSPVRPDDYFAAR
jgi:hypothetical protein